MTHEEIKSARDALALRRYVAGETLTGEDAQRALAEWQRLGRPTETELRKLVS